MIHSNTLILAFGAISATFSKLHFFLRLLEHCDEEKKQNCDHSIMMILSSFFDVSTIFVKCYHEKCHSKLDFIDILAIPDLNLKLPLIGEHHSGLRMEKLCNKECV